MTLKSNSAPTSKLNKLRVWPSAPSLWQEAVRLLEHFWVTVDRLADVNCTITLWDMKPSECGVLHTNTEGDITLLQFIEINWHLLIFYFIYTIYLHWKAKKVLVRIMFVMIYIFKQLSSSWQLNISSLGHIVISLTVCIETFINMQGLDKHALMTRWTYWLSGLWTSLGDFEAHSVNAQNQNKKSTGNTDVTQLSGHTINTPLKQNEWGDFFNPDVWL